jgi:hypothetical protein
MQIPDRLSFTRAIEALISLMSAASQIIAVISGSLTPIDSPLGRSLRNWCSDLPNHFIRANRLYVIRGKSCHSAELE